MIILDTNVLSALMRQVPEVPVIAWLDRQPTESVWITSITLFEARLGLALLPKGRRQQVLEAAFAQLLEEDLEYRVLDLTVRQQPRQRYWQPNVKRPDDRWTCVTRRSLALRWRGAPRWPPATYGIFRI